jgi:hypothetical protein
MAQKTATIVSAQPLVINLYAEIKAAVNSHAYSTNAPPFSPAELAVMAWVCSKNEQGIVTEKQIFKWAVKRFKYYADLAAEDAYNLARSTRKKSNSISSSLLQQNGDRNIPPRRSNLPYLPGCGE